LRKKIVATTEGGAITGEERLREHMDFVYGAIMSTEDKPTSYQMARVDALERELKDVEAAYAALAAGKLVSVNAQLKAKGWEEIAVHEPQEGAGGGGGGSATQLAAHLVGLRLFGSNEARSVAHEERD